MLEIKRNIGKNEFFQPKSKKEVFDCDVDDEENENDPNPREDFDSEEENEKEEAEEYHRKNPNSLVINKKPQKLIKYLLNKLIFFPLT